MAVFSHPVLWIIGCVLIISSLGMITARKPVHSSLFFLLNLLSLAALYIQLSAEFIAIMQILVYAGAILVLFMFVIILFQDAHAQINQFKPQAKETFLVIAGTIFVISLIYLGIHFWNLPTSTHPLPEDFGTVQELGHALYLNFFFPFEAVILLFLIAVVGSLYTAKKVK